MTGYLTALKRVKDGAWNMLRSQFVHPKTINAWAIVMYAGTMEDGQRCATELKKSFQDLGMSHACILSQIH